MDKSLIEEYFNDNGITASPFAQQDFLTRRKRYEKAQMTVANISDQEQARHFFNLYNIPLTRSRRATFSTFTTSRFRSQKQARTKGNSESCH